ncbi:MAG: NAD(P)H-dependent oxidoreductase subunit E [Chloroflexota bacterium]|nr:NAD(P)H-dependent oxidoreductase subunit E [Chloroflexota bacterium]
MEAPVQTKVAEIVERYQGNREFLISILQDIQTVYHYLPREALVEVSQRMEIPLSQLFGIATFFKAFSLKPRGEHLVHVCLGTACHVKGGLRLLEKLERDLKVKSGDTTPDNRFTLESVNCVGACSLAPIVVVDGKFQGRMKMDVLDRMVKKFK